MHLELGYAMFGKRHSKPASAMCESARLVQGLNVSQRLLFQAERDKRAVLCLYGTDLLPHATFFFSFQVLEHISTVFKQ